MPVIINFKELGGGGSGEGVPWHSVICPCFCSSPAVAALVNRTGLPEVTVAIDGSVYENHPKFHSSMMEILRNFCPKSKAR